MPDQNIQELAERVIRLERALSEFAARVLEAQNLADVQVAAGFAGQIIEGVA